MMIELDGIIELVGLQLGLRVVRGGDFLKEDLGADSTDLLNLLVAIEDRFGVVIDELQAADVRTVEELYQLARRQLMEAEPLAGEDSRE